MWLFLFHLLCSSVSADTCRALSMSGGGSRGCYEVGVVWSLVNNLPPSEVAWDVVSGISTGSLNTVGFSLYPKGQELGAVNLIKEAWFNITGTESIFKEWPEGVVYSILGKPSLFDSSPLRNLVTNLFTLPVSRKVTVGTTSLNTGAFVNYDESQGRNLIDVVMSSTAIPCLFPYQKFNNDIYIDGGTVFNQDVFSAINRCYEITKNESDIIVDLVFCGNQEDLKVSTTNWTTLTVLGRLYSISSYDKEVWYIYNAMLAYPQVNFRYIFFPTKKIPGSLVPLDFNPKDIREGYDVGVSDAINAINRQELLNEGLEQRFTNLFKITPVS